MSNQRCTACGLVKPLDQFHYRKDRGTYRNQCKTCFGSRPSAAAKRAGRKAKVTQVTQEYVLVDRKRRIVERVSVPVLSSKPLDDIRNLEDKLAFYRGIGCIVVEIGE